MKATSINKHSRIVVIGTSAGGLQALVKFTAQLQEDFPAPILVVHHMAAGATGNALLQALSEQTSLKCHVAKNGATLKTGHIYLAPPDQHLMIGENDCILLTKGAQENRYRPAIDPLFRSAAVAFGNRVIGILLTGYLDDGTAGLSVIKRCGGVCIVQDPAEADYPDMPENALNQVDVDYCLPLAKMGAVIQQLLVKKLGITKAIPGDILIESDIAKRVLSDLPAVNSLGEQVPFNCPGCGGILWKMDKGGEGRFRCHTGHAYTQATLLAAQTEKIEETMWTALRMFEERKNLLTNIAKKSTGAMSQSAAERAEASLVHIERIKSMLLAVDIKY